MTSERCEGRCFYASLALVAITHLAIEVKKCEVLPAIDHEGQEVESRNRSILSITSGLYEDGWSMPCLCSFTCGKETWYPLYRRLDGP